MKHCRTAKRSTAAAIRSRTDSSVTDEIVPHFHNDPGVPVIEIGAKKFMCMGALPPHDHPHVYCDMGDAIEYVCPYCATLYRHNPALVPNEARPAECELHDVII
jgi:uncharacterized Zn-finger protein